MGSIPICIVLILDCYYNSILFVQDRSTNNLLQRYYQSTKRIIDY